MAITAIVHLAERLLNNTSSEGKESPTTAKQSKAGPVVGANLIFEDQFTSSVNGPPAGQEAGLFGVNRFALLSAAANFFLAQRPDVATAPEESPAATKKQAPLASQESPATQSVKPVPANVAPVAASAPANQPVAGRDTVRSQVPNAGGPTPNQASEKTEEVQATTAIPQTGSALSDSNGQSQLQALNSALAALGLSAMDIAVIDRISSLIGDFSPTAYARLVQQLEFLAESHGTPPAPGGSTLAHPSNGLQIQELIVRFSAVNETLQGGESEKGGTTVQVSAFHLQVEGIRMTFTNNEGKTVLVETPQSTTPGNTQSDGTTVTGAKVRVANA